MTTHPATEHARALVWRRRRRWMAVGIGLAWSPIVIVMIGAIRSGCHWLIAAEMPLFIMVPWGGLITWWQLRDEESHAGMARDIEQWSSGRRRREG